MAVTVLLSVDSLLPNAGLHVLVHVRIGEAQHHAVGPGPARESHFGHHRLVMIRVVEAAHAVERLRVEAVCGEVEHGRVNVEVVVRIVLEGVYLVHEAVSERLAEVYVRLVGVERAVRISRVDKPAAPLPVGHDVDYAAYGVGAEAHGYHALVHLYAVGEVHGDVVQPERAAHALLRHSVDEHLDVLAAEAVEHQIHV